MKMIDYFYLMIKSMMNLCISEYIKPTPKKIAKEAVELTYHLLTENGYQELENLSRLEPCCGNGVFIDALIDYFAGVEVDIEAFEINDKVNKFLERKYSGVSCVDICNEDYLLSSTEDKYDVIVGGLPFEDEIIDKFIKHSLMKCYLICCFVVPINYECKYKTMIEIKYEKKNLKTIAIWHNEERI